MNMSEDLEMSQNLQQCAASAPEGGSEISQILPEETEVIEHSQSKTSNVTGKMYTLVSNAADRPPNDTENTSDLSIHITVETTSIDIHSQSETSIVSEEINKHPSNDVRGLLDKKKHSSDHATPNKKDTTIVNGSDDCCINQLTKANLPSNTADLKSPSPSCDKKTSDNSSLVKEAINPISTTETASEAEKIHLLNQSSSSEAASSSENNVIDKQEKSSPESASEEAEKINSDYRTFKNNLINKKGSSEVGSAADEAEKSNTNNEHVQSDVNEIANDTFKQPKTPKGKKRMLPTSTDQPIPKKITATSKTAASSIASQPEPCGRKTVNIYTDDQFPQWLEIPSNVPNVSRTIVPNKLVEAFSFLPIFGRPQSKADLPKFQENKIRDFVGSGLSDEDFNKLAQYASADHFLTGKEMEINAVLPTVGLFYDLLMYKPVEPDPNQQPLSVVKQFKLRRKRDTANLFTKRLKYRGVRLMSMPEDDSSPSETDEPLTPGKDILFHIRIYRPFPYNTHKLHRGRHSVFARDLVMVGSQKLTELRDSFICANDLDMRVDLSTSINDSHKATAKELFPSGFLFINNIFYVDSRPGCADISERIRAWAVHKRGLGTFPCRDMCGVTLGELALRLGHPEVYVHQGNCEHPFTVSEVRLVSPLDGLSRALLPCSTAVSQNQTVYCTTCGEFGAKYIVSGCNRVPFDPAFFCDTCLNLYLYKDGKKLCDFKAFSFRGNEVHSMKPQA